MDNIAMQVLDKLIVYKVGDWICIFLKSKFIFPLSLMKNFSLSRA